MSDAQNYDLIVVGWGKAGKTLAQKAASRGKRVAMVEQDPAMYGGACINVACLPSKAMVHASCTAARAGLDDAGLKEAYRAAQDHRAQLVAQLNKKNYDALADEAQVDVFTGRAALKGPHTVAVTSAMRAAEASADPGTGATGTAEAARSAEAAALLLESPHIVLDAGSKPKILPIQNKHTDFSRVLTSAQALELKERPERLLVVGAGFTGLEFASYFANFGTQVEVVYPGDDWLPSEDSDMAQAIRMRMEEQGVVFSSHSTLEDGSEDADGIDVEIITHGSTRRDRFDYVLVAVGRMPHTTTLGLETAGIRRGEEEEIIVDPLLRTGADGIWAAGDVKGGPQFTFISLDDARIIGPQLFDGAEPPHTSDDRPAYATCTFIDPPYARVGLNEKAARTAGLAYEVHTLPTASIPKAQVTGETTGLSKVLTAADGSILGAALWHAEAHEMINIFTLAINHGISADALGNGIYTHPSFTESLNQLLG